MKQSGEGRSTQTGGGMFSSPSATSNMPYPHWDPRLGGIATSSRSFRRPKEPYPNNKKELLPGICFYFDSNTLKSSQVRGNKVPFLSKKKWKGFVKERYPAQLQYKELR